MGRNGTCMLVDAFASARVIKYLLKLLKATFHLGLMQVICERFSRKAQLLQLVLGGHY